MSNFLFLKTWLLNNIDEKYIRRDTIRRMDVKNQCNKSYMMQHGSGVTVACVVCTQSFLFILPHLSR